MTTSVTGNAQAFGFAITITVTYGMVNTVQRDPTTVDLVLFALGGVLTFSMANLLVATLVRAVEADAEPPGLSSSGPLPTSSLSAVGSASPPPWPTSPVDGSAG